MTACFRNNSRAERLSFIIHILLNFYTYFLDVPYFLNPCLCRLSSHLCLVRFYFHVISVGISRNSSGISCHVHRTASYVRLFEVFQVLCLSFLFLFRWKLVLPPAISLCRPHSTPMFDPSLSGMDFDLGASHTRFSGFWTARSSLLIRCHILASQQYLCSCFLVFRSSPRLGLASRCLPSIPPS